MGSGAREKERKEEKRKEELREEGNGRKDVSCIGTNSIW